jgi:nucleoid-associated protein YgaU
MGTAHEEAGHGHAERATPQPAVAIGQAASGGSKVGAAAYAAQAGVNPRDWMPPAPRNPWKRRIGAGVVAGLLGTLGWVGFKQFPSNAVNAASNPPTEETTAEEFAPLGGVEFDELNTEPSFQANADSNEAELTGGNPFATDVVRKNRPLRSQSPTDTERPVENFLSTDASNPFASSSPVESQAPESQTLTAENTNELEDSGTVPAEFGEAQSEPAIVEVDSTQFSGQAATSTEDESAVVRVAAISEAHSENPFGPAGSDQPARPSKPVSAKREVAFQFGEAPAQEEPAPILGAPSDSTAEESSNSGFEFEDSASEAPGAAPAFAEPTTTSPAFAEPSTSPAFEEAGSEPRIFSAPGNSQEIDPALVIANDPKDEKVHVVQPGENYWSIAKQHYSAGRYFGALAEYNKSRIADPKQLKPGMKVLIPSAGTLEQRFAKLIQPGGPGAGQKKAKSGLSFDAHGMPQYCVGEGDTLGTIAQRHLGRFARWEEIYNLNRDQLKTQDALKLGTILRMPEDASQLEPARVLPASR